MSTMRAKWIICMTTARSSQVPSSSHGNWQAEMNTQPESIEWSPRDHGTNTSDTSGLTWQQQGTLQLPLEVAYVATKTLIRKYRKFSPLINLCFRVEVGVFVAKVYYLAPTKEKISLPGLRSIFLSRKLFEYQQICDTRAGSSWDHEISSHLKLLIRGNLIDLRWRSFRQIVIYR